MIKLVYFDYGGVIKDGYPLKKYFHKICDVSLEEAEKTSLSIKTFGNKASKGLISDEEFWKECSIILDKKLPDNYLDLAIGEYRANFIFKTDILNLAKKLRNQGIKTGILSNIFKFEADVIRGNGGYDEFDPTILSYEVGFRKPEAEIYRMAIDRARVKPEECIFIDDKKENLILPEQLGIKTILFKNPKQVIDDVWKIVDVNKNE
ncbi:MAG: HAD family phosphatase [Candidatus Staskawiczbacteria bacterium]|jgi:putative hydrolase of the HAD superfamily